MLTLLLGLCCLTAPTFADETELVPAGTLNAAIVSRPIAIVAGESSNVQTHARTIRDHFMRGADLLSGEEALERDLSGVNLVVFGTFEDNAWLRRHADSLPFHFEEGRVVLLGQSFEGSALRVICTVRNPENPDLRVVIYAAAKPGDITGINNIFHGPTEWLVADGERTLGSGEYVLDGPVSAEAMRRDLDYLAELVASVHPATVKGLPEEVAKALAVARAACEKPLGRSEFRRLASRVLIALEDAHTRFALPRSASGVDLPVRWLDEGLVVAADAGPLKLWDRVLTVGGRDADGLLAGLREIIPAENSDWVRHVGEAALAQEATLSTLGLLEGDTLALVVERAGEQHVVELKLGPTSRSWRTILSPLPWVRFEIDEQASLGVFTLDTCRNDGHYREVLGEFFAAVQAAGVERVAIDVRANSGGNSSVVDEFLRYLDVESYWPYCGGLRVSEASVAQRGQERRGFGYHEFERRIKKNRRREQPAPFAGEVFVLTSKATFSSGNWFAVIIQDNDIGQVVGEATGNAPTRYGDILSFSLPETGSTFTMSYKKWVRPDPTRDPCGQLQPDHRVVLTLADLIAGRDPVLEYLRGLGKTGH